MNSNEEAHLDMFRGVSLVLSTYENIWEGDAVFNTLPAELDDVIADIELEVGEQTTDLSGSALAKQDARDTTTDKAISMADAAILWAEQNGKIVEKAKFDYTKSELNAMGDDDFLITMGKFYTMVNTNAVDLEAYGVTANMISSLNAGITAYRGFLIQPQFVHGRATIATDRISAIRERGMSLLNNRMDKGMERYASSADFYDMYHQQRKITDPSGGTVTTVIVRAMIAGTTTPLEDVIITLNNQPEFNPKNTEANGECTFAGSSISSPVNVHGDKAGYLVFNQNDNVVTIGGTNTIVIYLTPL
ncbi:MAG: hypothetical protein NTX03_13695 [Bacteroidetes bacterium]|nr:hypothetical protein [Bacteroidota bacterium]